MADFVEDAWSLVMTVPTKWWIALAPVAPSLPRPVRTASVAVVISSRSADGR